MASSGLVKPPLLRRSKEQVYVGALPLRASKGPPQLLMSTAYSLNLWDLQHFFVLIKPYYSPSQDFVVYDFQPKDPENIYTALAVLSGTSVPGDVRVRNLKRLPRSKCWLIGSSKVEDSLDVAAKFSDEWDTNLRVGHHDCRHYTNDHNVIIKTMIRLFVPMILQFTVVGSCNGLLCLWDPSYGEDGYIFNPFTTLYIRLPKPKQFLTQQRVAVGFGFSSSTKEYKVVRIVYYRTPIIGQVDLPVGFRQPPAEESEVEILTVKHENLMWRGKGKTSFQIRSEPSNVLVNGRLHWLTYRSHRHGHQARIKIISFNMDDEQFREIPNPSYKRFAVFCTHLVNLRGCLSGIVRCWGLIDIWAMKEYGVQESWVKEFRIGYTLPTDIGNHKNHDFGVPNNTLVNLSDARVLCILENGEILLQQGSGTLFSYDVKNECLKEMVTEKSIPACFKAIVHIGSLNSIDTPVTF